MSNVMKSMDVNKLSQTLEDFEKQFDDMTVKSQYMEGSMVLSNQYCNERTDGNCLLGRFQ